MGVAKNHRIWPYESNMTEEDSYLSSNTSFFSTLKLIDIWWFKIWMPIYWLSGHMLCGSRRTTCIRNGKSSRITRSACRIVGINLMYCIILMGIVVAFGQLIMAVKWCIRGLWPTVKRFRLSDLDSAISHDSLTAIKQQQVSCRH